MDVPKLYCDGLFDLYQAYQSAPVFNTSKMLVSFLGRGERQAVFVGIYTVGKVSSLGAVPLPRGTTLPLDVSQHHHYDLKMRPGFEDRVGRLVIDWGTGTRSWHQWFEPGRKPVVELLQCLARALTTNRPASQAGEGVGASAETGLIDGRSAIAATRTRVLKL